MAESTTNTYNQAGQLTQTVSGGETTSYTYDGAGNVVSQEELSGAAAAESTTNSYNQAGQLTQTVSGGETTSYSYDGAGNVRQPGGAERRGRGGINHQQHTTRRGN